MRLKITNTRTQYYPNALTETDYHKFKVGDLVCIGYNYNTIYQIESIFRDVLDINDEKRWLSKIVHQYATYGTTPAKVQIYDQKMFDLIQEYKKNGNFGVCRIKLKTLLRGTNLPKRAGTKLVWEPDQVSAINYNRIQKVDINAILKSKDHMIARVDRQISKLNSRKDNIIKNKQALEQLDNLLNPKLPEPVPTGIDEVEEKENVQFIPQEVEISSELCDEFEDAVESVQ